MNHDIIYAEYQWFDSEAMETPFQENYFESYEKKKNDDYLFKRMLNTICILCWNSLTLLFTLNQAKM